VKRLVLVGAAALVVACGSPPAERVPARAVVARPVGTWRGTGNQTIGDVMLASGRFRVRWKTEHERPAGAGTFRLTARSSVSGRPLQQVADHRGEGEGASDFDEEDRRTYDFTIESQNVEWSVTVEDLVVVESADHRREP
jgi:hypothetical protein